MIAYCGTYPFAVVRVEFDGSYTIEWSEWDSDHLDVTGYSVLLSQFLYRMYEDENGSNIDYNRLSQIYESCEFRSGEWDCQGALPPMNGWVDWEGNPTENLEFTTNEDLTEWSYAMEEPAGTRPRRPINSGSGDATDPDNEPETITIQTETYEMDLYNIYIFEGNEQVGRETILVHRRQWVRLGSEDRAVGTVAWSLSRGPHACGLGSVALHRCNIPTSERAMTNQFEDRIREPTRAIASYFSAHKSGRNDGGDGIGSASPGSWCEGRRGFGFPPARE